MSTLCVCLCLCDVLRITQQVFHVQKKLTEPAAFFTQVELMRHRPKFL